MARFFKVLGMTAVVAAAGCSFVLFSASGARIAGKMQRAAAAAAATSMSREGGGRVPDTWQGAAWPDPTAFLLADFRETAKNAPRVTPTGLTRADYLKIMAGEVDFWKKHQNAGGAIIDPYRNVEVQYSTPAFAYAAAALVVYAGRKDLLEPAARATDRAVQTLSERRSPDHHEDFYAPLLARTLMLLAPQVAPPRANGWSAAIHGFDPFKTYRTAPGSNNWNVVALSGEARFQQMGLRSKTSTFVEESLAGQGKTFGSPYGLYLEGPMAYDHFPRLWAADMLAGGSYEGKYKAPLAEMLRRAAITSLFMQSPWGELPAGGRSAQHQWNEAAQCVTYEIYAAQAQANRDAALAGVFKRAAHRSLASMKRWIRPGGEMQIVKNWVDPAEGHGYENYSAHSQYNLLPTAMLAMAYEWAEKTDGVTEKPAPAEVGGFVLSVPELHKIFANVAGTYIEIDTRGDHHYDATGLIRIQDKALPPQLGTSDSVPARPAYRVPAGVPPTTQTTGIGIAWLQGDEWHTLGQTEAVGRMQNARQSGSKAAFDVFYDLRGGVGGPSRVVEHYQVTPGRVELSTETPGYAGPLRYSWPVLADDGRRPTRITTERGTVSVGAGAAAQTFTPMGAARVSVRDERSPSHNGWMRIADADYPAQKGRRAVTLVIAPKVR